jgi:DnaJ-domain-containing protein 1
MELLAVVLMIAAGGLIAVFVTAAVAIARAESERSPAAAAAARPDRDAIAASLLFRVLTAGGMASDDSLREIRRGAGFAAAVARDVDVANWGDRFAQIASVSQRHELLETAVRLAVKRSKLIPLLQYVALLDLSFSLGFQTSALAALRERYGFEYIDHAKDARPRQADRGGRMTFFTRADHNPADLLRALEIEGQPTRQTIIAAYRRLVAQHHPDRFHEQPAEAQTAAAARFIEITRAYEALMATYRD